MRAFFLLISASLIAANASAQWGYNEDRDEMRGTVVQFYYTASLNKLDFEFPYAGGQAGTLIVRRIGKGNPQIIVTIDKGHMLCHVNNCAVTVKFDDGKPQSVGGSPSATRDTTMLMLNASPSLVNQMKKAKRFFVEIVYYKAGRKVLTFNVENFVWPPPQPGKPAKQTTKL